MALLRRHEMEITARFEPDAAPEMGVAMEIGIDMTRACVFNPDTRNLI